MRCRRLCAAVAALFWTVPRLCARAPPRARGARVAVAPALGWAVHSAAGAAVFSSSASPPPAMAVVAAARPGGRSCRVAHAACRRRESPPGCAFPSGPMAGAALLALAAGGGDPAEGRQRRGRVRADPIFDHAKVAMIDDMARLGLPPGNPFFGEVGEPASRSPTTTSGISARPSSRALSGAAAGKPMSRMTWFTAFASLAADDGLGDAGSAAARRRRCGSCCSRRDVASCGSAAGLFGAENVRRGAVGPRPASPAGCFRRPGCRSTSSRHRASCWRSS